MNLYYISFFLILFFFLVTLFFLRFFIANINKIHKFLFITKYHLNLKKYQHYFYGLEKYMEDFLISGQKYLKINNYIFKKNSKNSFSNKLKFKYIILILLNKSSNYLNYRLNSKKYNKNVSNNSINFIKIKSNNKKFSIINSKENEILRTFYINKNKKNLVLILFVDGMSGYLSNNLKNSINFFGKSNKFSEVFSNAPWTLPAFSNLITGQYTSTHLNYAPRSFYSNRKQLTETSRIKSDLTLFEYFQKKGYVTASYSPYVRINPTYNFDRGVDIFKYCEDNSADEIIDSLISQIEFFKDTSNFIFAHLFDVHHKLKNHDRLADFIYQPENHYNYIKINDPNKRNNFLEKIQNEKLKTFLDQKNFSEEVESINRIQLVDFRLERLYEYLRKKNFDDYTIILMGDHGTRFNSLDSTGNVLDKHHQNIGFFIKDKKYKNFLNKKKNYIETIDIFPSLVSKYGSINSKKINKKINGINTIFGNKVKNNVVSESIYNSDYNLLINYKENYLHSSYKIEKNIIVSKLETQYYDKNQKKIGIKNRNFPYKNLIEIEKKHILNSKLTLNKNIK